MGKDRSLEVDLLTLRQWYLLDTLPKYVARFREWAESEELSGNSEGARYLRDRAADTSSVLSVLTGRDDAAVKDHFRLIMGRTEKKE